MNRPIQFIILMNLGVLLFSGNANAQLKDTLIDNKVFEVEKTFKPILSEALKIPVNPNPEKPELKRPEFKYDQVAIQAVASEPNVYTIKPLSMGTSVLPKLKGNYMRVGFGNYSMPMGEIYLNTVRNRKVQAGVFLKHLSASGNEQFNNFSNNTAYGYVKSFQKKQVYSLDAYYYRNRVQLYATPKDIQNAEELGKRVYQTFDIKGAIASSHSDSSDFKHHTELNFYRYQNQAKDAENDYQIKTRLNKTFEGIPFELDAGLRINQYQFQGMEFNRRFFHFNPMIRLDDKDFYLHGGLNTFFATDSNGTNSYFFPKAEGGFHLVAKKLVVYAGLTGNPLIRTFRSITSENPFMNSPMAGLTVNRFEIFGGFKGQLGPMTAFTLQSSSSRLENNLFYGYDSSSYAQLALYDSGKGSLTRLVASLTHGIGDKWRFGTQVAVNNYTLSTLSKAFGCPELEIQAHALYHMGEKFTIRVDYSYWGKRYSLIKKPNSQEEVKLDPFNDVSLGLEYHYRKNLGAFVNLNNLASTGYQRWYNYPVYGFNLLAGFNFTF